MRMTEEFLMDLGECDHRPLHPPRDGVIGEHVFAERWQKFMGSYAGVDDDGESNYRLRSILSSLPAYVTQRHATVAATFITWLGTNCGRAFLEEGRRLEENAKSPGYGAGYDRAWAEHNARHSWLNSGFRTVEHLLATKEDRCPQSGRLIYRPDLTTDDYEVCELVARWLGTKEGKEFVDACNADIRERMDALRKKRAIAQVSPIEHFINSLR